jgi:hypothetical protein
VWIVELAGGGAIAADTCSDTADQWLSCCRSA